ncbi:hypothetical protein MXB_1162, partial [Myxobolus squamalis]
NIYLFCRQRPVVKTPAELSQGNLPILQLVYIPVHAQVGLLVIISFHGSVEVKPTKNTSNLLPLEMPNPKGNGV